MRKRAAIARAMALDPEILFLDEPSAGLDPISSRLLDDLILELRDSLGMTIVIVTHELASIFAIGDNSVFLDVETRTMIATGHPRWLLEHSDQAEGARLPHPRASRSARHEPDGPAPAPAIGLFVLGGIVLAVLGLIVFGGSRFFSHGDRLRHLLRRIAEGPASRRARDLPRRRHRPGRPRSAPIYDKDTGEVRVPVTVELRPGALMLTDGMAGGSDVLMRPDRRVACARAWTCRACSPGSC